MLCDANKEFSVDGLKRAAGVGEALWTHLTLLQDEGG